VESGKFELSVPKKTPLGADQPRANFWTTPFPFWDMEVRDAGLFGDLKQSGLVIFKGDLNYRKLTGDVKWPSTTPFETAIGPLGGSFPILSLRTNKADVAVGLDQETIDRVEKEDPKWRVNGKYALISFMNQNQS